MHLNICTSTLGSTEAWGVSVTQVGRIRWSHVAATPVARADHGTAHVTRLTNPLVARGGDTVFTAPHTSPYGRIRWLHVAAKPCIDSSRQSGP